MSDTYSIYIRVCPECGTPLEFQVKDGPIAREEAWTESDDVVVIPTICPKCSYTGMIRIIRAGVGG